MMMVLMMKVTTVAATNATHVLYANAVTASGDHSRIFLAQYMRKKPCILPSSTICLQEIE